MFNFIHEIEKEAKERKSLSVIEQEVSVKEDYLYSLVQVKQMNDRLINRRKSYVLQLLSASNPYRTQYVVAAEKDISLFIALLDTQYFVFPFEFDFDFYNKESHDTYYRIIFYDNKFSLDLYNPPLYSIEKDFSKIWKAPRGSRGCAIAKDINEIISNIRNKQYNIFIDKENNKIKEINIAILDLHNLEGNSYGY